MKNRLIEETNHFLEDSEEVVLDEATKYALVWNSMKDNQWPKENQEILVFYEPRHKISIGTYTYKKEFVYNWDTNEYETSRGKIIMISLDGDSHRLPMEDLNYWLPMPTKPSGGDGVTI